MKICEQCKTEFVPLKRTQRFCSNSCANKFRWSQPDYKERVSKSISRTKKRLFAEGKLLPPHLFIRDKEKWRRNIGKINLGRVPWNKGKTYRMSMPNHHLRGKTYEEAYGRERARLIKEHIRKRMSEVAKAGKWVKHIFDNAGVRPTRLEIRFMELCDKNNLPFKYTGDGSFWIGRLNPDFIESNGNKVAIEIFGEYWHSPLLNPMVQKYGILEVRRRIFTKHGWKLIVFWGSELNDEELVIRRLEDEGCHY